MRNYIKTLGLIIKTLLVIYILLRLISPLFVKLSFKLAGIEYITNHNFIKYVHRPSTIFIILFFILLNITLIRLTFKKRKFSKIIILCIISIFVIDITINVCRETREGIDFNLQLLNDTKITAHRGNSISKPENTIQAFNSAVDNLADYIELDIRLTKDNVPVVFHDRSLIRITGHEYKIKDLSFNDLKSFDVGSWFDNKYSQETVPSFEEIIYKLKGNVKFNIELKSVKNNAVLVDKVIKIINLYNIERDCIITSSNYDILKMVKEISHEYKTGYILKMGYGQLENLSYADIICLNKDFVTRSTVYNLHKNGKEIHVWTVNDKNSLKKMIHFGVDNIITDDTLLAAQIKNSQDKNDIVRIIGYVFPAY